MNDLVSFEDIRCMAAAMAFGGMFGKSADQLIPLMLIAQAEHKHPAVAAMEYDIIQGRPAINSRAALSRFQAAGGSIQWTKRTDTECSAKMSHPQGGTLEVSWTIERAQKAGLTGKDNWKKYPAQMLAARVVSEGVRAIFPACLSALYTSEEVHDFVVPDRDVTPEVNPLFRAPEPFDYGQECKRLVAKIGITDDQKAELKATYGGDLEKIYDYLDKLDRRLTAEQDAGDDASARAEDEATV